jgi:ribosomal protein S18 acetylase RimI-like enzyme
LNKARIRQVQEADLPGLEWDGEYAHFRRLYADAFERSRRGKSVLWVAELPEVGLVGQAFVQLVCDRPELADGVSRAYMYAFRVRHAYRGRGLGSHILSRVEEDLRKRGFHSVTLNVARNNPGARRLYERHGYHVVAPESGIWSYLDEKGEWHTMEEPAWRMEKKLR